MSLERRVDRIGGATSYVFAVVVVITTYEVLMRYAFGSPTSWVHELSIALSAAAFAFGGPYAAASDAHLRITAVVDRLGPGGRGICALLSVVSGVLYLGGLAYAFAVRAIETGWKFSDGQWAPERTGRTWDVPIPPFMNALIAICCALFLVLLIVRFWSRDRSQRSAAH